MEDSGCEENSLIYDDENEPEEDYREGGYHRAEVGDMIGERYEILQKVGWGHFSTVWLCRDHTYGTFVGLKIQKSAPNYTQAAYDEIAFLSKLAGNTQQLGSQDCFVVQLLNYFTHSGPNGEHVCMVLEILGVNLLEVIKHYNYKGLPIDLCQSIARQVLIGLDYVHRVCGIIHTDLKPENVLLQLSHEQIVEIISNKVFLNKIPKPSTHRSESLNRSAELDEKTKKRREKKQRYRQRKKEERKKQREDADVPPTARKRKRNRKRESIPDIRQSLNPRMLKSLAQQINNKTAEIDRDFQVKIVDFGNACWENHHHSDLIQTRQYRGPEVILGITYNTSADMWSFACMMFELLTGDLLFEPKNGDCFDKNDDHLAQMFETLGIPPMDWAMSGRYSRKYLNRFGILKRIKELKIWLLEDVLVEKYKFKPAEAASFTEFLLPMLAFHPEKRISAREALKNPWLTRSVEQTKMTEQEHLILTQRLDRQKMERLEKIERGEAVSPPEMPMPYFDEADNEEAEDIDGSSFSSEDPEQDFFENKDYHHKMNRIKRQYNL